MFRKLVWGCIGATVLLASILFAAQTPNTSNLGLVGDRFKPLTWDQMTPEQKTMTTNVLNGPRNNLGGPFNVLLRSPEMGDLTQKLGEYARFRPSVPAKIRELAIIVAARHWTAQFEWNAHRRAAAQAGLGEPIIQAIANSKKPTGMQPDEEAAYNFANELMETTQVSDATFKAAVDKFGEKGVVDIIVSNAGYRPQGVTVSSPLRVSMSGRRLAKRFIISLPTGDALGTVRPNEGRGL
jgi:4-carboxymuconolactone decarboxylase